MKPAAWFLAAVLGVTLGHAGARGAEPVDLNIAPAEQLQQLPGIGPKKAEAIIALRQKRVFSRVSQLLEVRGIGKKTLERLKPLVKVGPAALGSGLGTSTPAGRPEVTERPREQAAEAR